VPEKAVAGRLGDQGGNSIQRVGLVVGMMVEYQFGCEFDLFRPGNPAGEMKHGPIALIDEDMPIVAIALKDAVYDKMISQIEQAKARGGKVIALATEGDTVIAGKADYVLTIPATPPLLSPIVAVIPLQMLAYAIALRRGADVDQPRNLAKSVTVE